MAALVDGSGRAGAWERLLREPDEVAVPEAHLAELERRLAEHVADPDDVVAWDDVRDAVRPAWPFQR